MAEPTRNSRTRSAVGSQSNSESSSSTQQNGSGASKNGAKQKKFIQPTIPVRCAKVEQEAPAEQKPHEKPFVERDRGRDGLSSSRGKGRSRPDIIKFTGTIFGQASEVSKLGGSYMEKESKSSSARNLKKPRISSTVAKDDTVEEDKAFRMLMRDDFVDTGYENVLMVQPTLLPKTKLGCSVQNEVDVDIKMEVDSNAALSGVIRINQEKMEIDSMLNKETAQSYERRANLTQVAVKEGDIVLIQLPDVLPYLKTAHERSPATKPAPGAALEQADYRTIIAPANIFKDIPDGRLGSLRIHKSGIMSLQLGEYSSVLDTATQVSFSQDLISVEVETDGKPGTMKDLGPVNYQAVCLPTDWNQLMVEDE